MSLQAHAGSLGQCERLGSVGNPQIGPYLKARHTRLYRPSHEWSQVGSGPELERARA